MTIDRVEAWLRFRDSKRFQRDAKESAHAVDEIGDAAKRTEGHFKDANGRMRDAKGRFVDMKGAAEGLTDAMGGGSGGGGVLGSMGSFGRLSKGVIMAVIGMLPIIVALGGALVAVAGSAALAAAGLGALAVSGLGVLAVGLGPLVGVGVGIAHSFKAVNDALNAFHEAVKTYGKDSTQAKTAMDKFQAAVKMHGGKEMLTLVRNIKALGTTWRSVTQPAMKSMVGLLGDASGAARSLLPTIGDIANKSAGALRKGLEPIFKNIKMGGLDKILKGLGDSFARIAGPASNMVYKIIKGLGNIAVLAAPYLERLVKGMEGLAKRFATWSASPAAATAIKTIMGHLQSWWNLLKAIGGLLATVLGGGAKEGKGLVDSLTGVVNKWNEWLKSDAGQAAMKSFFKDAIDLTKTFFKFLAQLTAGVFLFGRAFMPVYNEAIKPVISVIKDLWNQLKPLAPFFKILGGVLLVAVKVALFNMLLPFRGLVLLLKLVNWLVKNAGAIWNGFLGVLRWIWGALKFVWGIFMKVIQVLAKFSPLLALARAAVIHAGDAFRIVAGIAKTAFGAMKSAVGWVIDKVQALWNKTSGVRDAIKGAWSGVWDGLKAGFKAVYDFIKQGLEWVFNKIDDVKGLLDSIPDITPWDGLSPIGGDWLPPSVLAAAGGSAGTPVGPSLRPMIPSPSAPDDSTGGDLPSLAPASGSGKRTIILKTFLKGKQIAEAVHDDIDDDLARR